MVDFNGALPQRSHRLLTTSQFSELGLYAGEVKVWAADLKL
jgi:hypothetical protein